MERVELNLHTDMSKMKGFIEVKDYIKKSIRIWNDKYCNYRL